VDFSPPTAIGVCDVCHGDVVLRDDDQEKTVRRRLEVYRKETAVLLDYYRERGELRTVDGNRHIDRVLSELLSMLVKQ